MKVGPLGFPRPLGIGPMTKERSEFAQRVNINRRRFVTNCIETVDADDLLTEEQVRELSTREIQRFEREACQSVADMLSL